MSAAAAGRSGTGLMPPFKRDMLRVTRGSERGASCCRLMRCTFRVERC